MKKSFINTGHALILGVLMSEAAAFSNGCIVAEGKPVFPAA